MNISEKKGLIKAMESVHAIRVKKYTNARAAEAGRLTREAGEAALKSASKVIAKAERAAEALDQALSELGALGINYSSDRYGNNRGPARFFSNPTASWDITAPVTRAHSDTTNEVVAKAKELLAASVCEVWARGESAEYAAKLEELLAGS